MKYDSEKEFVSVCLYYERGMSILVKFSFEGEFFSLAFHFCDIMFYIVNCILLKYVYM